MLHVIARCEETACVQKQHPDTWATATGHYGTPTDLENEKTYAIVQSCLFSGSLQLKTIEHWKTSPSTRVQSITELPK